VELCCFVFAPHRPIKTKTHAGRWVFMPGVEIKMPAKEKRRSGTSLKEKELTWKYVL